MAPAIELEVPLSRFEKLGVILTAWQAPVVGIFALLTSPFTSWRAKAGWRIFVDASARFVAGSLNIRQLRSLLRPTMVTYTSFAREQDLEPIVEDIGEGAKLLWVGPKTTGRLILWFHGGGYVLPMESLALEYFRSLQLRVQKRVEAEVGLVTMKYDLVPEAPFPTQLRQGIAALTHLFNSGVHPEKLQVVGDSAGAGIILQCISHILHPDPLLPPLAIPSTAIAGVYLMSPYTNASCDGPTFVVNSTEDMLSPSTMRQWGAALLAGVPPEKRIYVEAVRADPAWWAGSEAVVKRFLVTLGEKECLAGDIFTFVSTLQRAHPSVRCISVEGGIHNEPLPDLRVPGRRYKHKAELMIVQIVDWLVEGF